MADLLAHRLQNLGRAARLLTALDQWIEVGGEAIGSGPVARRRDNGTRGDEEVRTGDAPLVDGALDRHIPEPRTFRAEVAQDREARQQRVAGMQRRRNGPIGERLVEHLVVP